MDGNSLNKGLLHLRPMSEVLTPKPAISSISFLRVIGINLCITYIGSLKSIFIYTQLNTIPPKSDSHVRAAYEHQQRASVVYNPKKPGRPSFHPLFFFVGETRDFLHGLFRTGRAHASRGAKKFVDECL